MAGVFAILQGCSGLEEQAIARAMRVLRGGNPDGHATELADHEEWQAYREAAMAGLVRKAMLGYGGAVGPADTAATSASRRLQVLHLSPLSINRALTPLPTLCPLLTIRVQRVRYVDSSPEWSSR